MKFTEEQINKVVTLRTELVEKVNAFEHGVEYGKKRFEPPESSVLPVWPTWIDQLRSNIQELEIEEMKIMETIISEFDEAAFYVLLGRHFERCYAAIESTDESNWPYFYSIIGVYQKNVMEALKE